MNFQKFASVSTLAVATIDENGFTKSATYEEDTNSAYLRDGNDSLNIIAALKIVASEYDISDNPSDYIFEAIRGNTTNIPNDNKDAFHKHELLRFDHRLSKQVYRTYELKPHHINHRAENPKNARGFILDAHYNDSAAPLDNCPNCNNKTASVDDRDSDTGIHCRKCGTVVKDEFVELLVAIDTKKDPTFARGVQSGVLKHGSMGCSCLRTRCNVCGKVAYSRNEFCKHIAKNKGKEYDDSEPGFNPIAFVITYPKDKTAGKTRKTAKAFEWCEGVIYDEYSRVHDPADPKAEQYEILKLSAKVAQLTNDDNLQHESEIIILQTKVAELERILEDKLSKVAQAAPPMPPPPAGLPPPGSKDPSPPGMDVPAPLPLEEDEEQKVEININVGEEGIDVTSPELEDIAKDETPIEELTPENMGATPAGPGAELSPAAMGIATPPRIGQKEIVGGPSMLRFADSYKHLKAEITTAGNIRIHDSDGTLFVVKPDRIDVGKIANVEPESLAKNVLTMIAQFGMGGAISKTNAIMGPRLAQVLEHHVDDMSGIDRDDTSSILDNSDTDTKDKHSKSKDTVTGDGADSDRKDEYDETVSLKNDSLDGRETDAEDEQHNRDSGNLSVVEDADSDKRDDRKEYKMSDSAIDDIALDHKGKVAAKKCKECKCDPCECKEDKKKKKASDECDKCGASPCACIAEKEASYDIKVHAARLEKLYNNRLEKKIAEIEAEKEQFIKNLSDRFARSIKLIAKRQALNLEYSPLKTAMGIALCNPCNLGNGYEYKPMDQKTAVTLVEAGFNDPIIDGTDKPSWELFIDGLIDRSASVMEWNDETLMQIEADLSSIKTASVPLDDTAFIPEHDMNLRQAASQGNLQLNPQTVDTVVDKKNKVENIRRAVGATKVAGLANSR
jgi:uncharacterized C2H2 Zn-finger protein